VLNNEVNTEHNSENETKEDEMGRACEANKGEEEYNKPRDFRLSQR
jgi:hypothetical protein